MDTEGNPYIAVSINSDVYMYKLNPQGDFEASEPFGAYGCYGSAYLDIAFGSAVGRSNDPSVYVTGESIGYLDDPNDCRLNNGTDELFLIKFDGNLNKKWHTQFGTGDPNNLSSMAMGVAVDSEDNAYVTGYTNSIIAEPNPYDDLEQNQGATDSFIAKFAGYDGHGLWAEQFGTIDNDRARDVTVDSKDNLYVVGNTDGAFDGEANSGATEAFAAKYDKDGNELVVSQFGSAGSDYPQGVAHDPLTKSVFVTGNTDGSIGGEQNKGGFDGFLVKVRDENFDAGPPPGAEPKTPVIFVPGIAGTRLNYAAGLQAGTEKWPRSLDYLTNPGQGDPVLLDLRLAADGIHPFDNPYDPRYETSVEDIIRTEVGQDVYAITISEFEDAGYEEGVGLTQRPDLVLSKHELYEVGLLPVSVK